MKAEKYDPAFFEGSQERVESSARTVVPLLMELFKPESVVDFGCGTGTWLAVFKKLGVKTILGLDGEWVSERQLMIDKHDFQQCDLACAPLVDHPFGLALSLEVAEHLPDAVASRFVEAITNASSIVIFSAAIPFQGGTGHINEQWPEYWAKLFQSRDFVALDILRPRLWDDPRIEPYYAQNMFAFVSAKRVAEFESLANGRAEGFSNSLTRIHPKLWESKMIEAQDFARYGTVKLLRALARSVVRSVAVRLGK